MDRIGLYKQITEFTTNNAGTSEWCKAELDGKFYFIKKFHNPVYPSKEIGLPEKKYQARVVRFHEAMSAMEDMYQALRRNNTSGALILPSETINYQYHICTISEYVTSNVSPDKVHKLSEWQRINLMQALTLALIDVHNAGIVHSDLKPENILISQDDKGHCTLRLIDFDGSFFESNPPQNGEEIHGDPAFFAPEVYRIYMGENQQLDRRMDVFALGIIFHYFWCGFFPEKPADQSVGECILNTDGVKLSSELPPVIKQLIEWMLKNNPEDRLSCDEISYVLGIQATLYPVREIVLNRKPLPKKKAIRILFCDSKGATLSYRTIKVEPGTSIVINAEEIENYHLTSIGNKKISVDNEGNILSEAGEQISDRTIRFFYSKNKSQIKWPVYAACFCAIFFLAWALLWRVSMEEYKQGNWAKAKRYMDITPLFASFFEEQYAITQRNVAFPVADSELNVSNNANEMDSAATKGSTAFKKTAKLVTATPKATKAPTPTPTPTLSPTLTPNLTPTPSSTPIQTPTQVPTPTPIVLSNLSVGDVFMFGVYEQDNVTANGKEPIEWLVLDVQDDEVLVISKYELDAITYHSEWASVTWETCSLRNWLNGEFYDGAFTAEEKTWIVKKTISNPDSYSGAKGGNDTTDWIFLLSVDEAERYFTSDEARRAKQTKYAESKGFSYGDTDGFQDWRLRSVGSNGHFTAYVKWEGTIIAGDESILAETCRMRPSMVLHRSSTLKSESITTQIHRNSNNYPHWNLTNDYITLEKGASGERVRKIQKKLIEYGYLTGKADGKYGTKTQQAIEDFQRNNGIFGSYGIATTMTQAVLFNEKLNPASSSKEGTYTNHGNLLDWDVETALPEYVTLWMKTNSDVPVAAYILGWYTETASGEKVYGNHWYWDWNCAKLERGWNTEFNINTALKNNLKDAYYFYVCVEEIYYADGSVYSDYGVPWEKNCSRYEEGF